jgi:hypothetical protein
MQDIVKRFRAATTLAEVIEVLVPGTSDAVRDVRSSIQALSEDVGVHGALIVGPAGSGKSTLARVIGLGRYVHLLKKASIPRVLESIGFDGPARISPRKMEWYQEQSLSGLVESLADMQLFGIGEGVATGVKARDGLFRRAMHGLPTAESEDPTPAAAATGGVVFLDEIGDLPPPLQPKLLTVLTGADMYPVGLTGVESAVYKFEGLTIAATWKTLDNVRPDLVARLSDHRLEVPSLADRREDIPGIAALVLAELRRQPRETVERILTVPNESVDKERLKSSLDAGSFRLTSNDIRVLQRAAWQDLGELRGMTQVIRRAMRGDITVRVALERHARAMAQRKPPSHPDPLYARVLDSPAADDDTLISAVGRVERDMRAEMLQTLKTDPAKLERIASHLGRDPVEIRRRLSELPRLRDAQPTRRKKGR